MADSFVNLAPIQELYVSPDSAQKLKREAADLVAWSRQRFRCGMYGVHRDQHTNE